MKRSSGRRSASIRANLIQSGFLEDAKSWHERRMHNRADLMPKLESSAPKTNPSLNNEAPKRYLTDT